MSNNSSGSSSGTSTAHPPHWAKWKGLLDWSPFKIDALGLVTLLGAEEINASVGRLVRSTWFEYFPLLATYVIAGDRFRSKEAGFNLYNITQGIHTTDMAAWLTRWMQSQKFDTNRSIVRWTVEPREVSWYEMGLGAILPVCANGMLIAMTILSYDWYGFANAIAMFTSIVVRCYMVSSIRSAIDEKVQKAYEKTKPDTDNTSSAVIRRWNIRQKLKQDPEAKVDRRPHYLEHGWNGSDIAKVLIIMNDAKAVTMLVPRDLLPPPSVFIANLPAPSRAWYGIARWVGWLAFAVQVVTLGMADLATQIVTVALLIIPTVLFIAKLGCPDSRWQRNVANFLRNRLKLTSMGNWIHRQHHYGPNWPELKSVSWIGSMLKAEVYEWPVSHEFVFTDPKSLKPGAQWDPKDPRSDSKRQWLYAWLQLSPEEKLSMDKWDLFPHERNNNKDWLNLYDQMTKRTVQLQKSKWGVKSLLGTQSTTQPPVPPAPQAPPQQAAPQVPKLDTVNVPKPPHHRHLHHGTKSSKDKEDSVQDTADTAQDGTALEPNTPSIHTSPSEYISSAAAHRASVATGFQATAQDEREGIRPVRRAETAPVRMRRHSLADNSARPGGGAFWLSNRVMQQEEGGETESDGVATRNTSDSDDTVSAVEQRTPGGDGLGPLQHVPPAN